jgi:hypothetical protein
MTSFDLGALYKRYPEIILKFQHIFLDYGAGPVQGIRGVRNGGLGSLVKGDKAGNAQRLTINPTQSFILAPSPNLFRSQIKKFGEGLEVFSYHADYVNHRLKPVIDYIQSSDAVASRKLIEGQTVVDTSSSIKICCVLGFDELDVSGILIILL